MKNIVFTFDTDLSRFTFFLDGSAEGYRVDDNPLWAPPNISRSYDWRWDHLKQTVEVRYRWSDSDLGAWKEPYREPQQSMLNEAYRAAVGKLVAT